MTENNPKVGLGNTLKNLPTGQQLAFGGMVVTLLLSGFAAGTAAATYRIERTEATTATSLSEANNENRLLETVNSDLRERLENFGLTKQKYNVLLGELKDQLSVDETLARMVALEIQGATLKAREELTALNKEAQRQLSEHREALAAATAISLEPDGSLSVAGNVNVAGHLLVSDGATFAQQIKLKDSNGKKRMMLDTLADNAARFTIFNRDESEIVSMRVAPDAEPGTGGGVAATNWP